MKIAKKLGMIPILAALTAALSPQASADDGVITERLSGKTVCKCQLTVGEARA